MSAAEGANKSPNRKKEPHAAADHRPADGAAPEDSTPHRKLTDEEVKQCADRLSKPFNRDVELPPLIARKVISKEAQEQSLARLYTQSIEKKKQWKEKATAEKTKELLKPSVVDKSELDGAFDRLYIQTLELRRRNQEVLDKKYHPEPENKKKFTSKDEQFESAKRLCDGSVEKAREVQRALFEKYVMGTAPKFAKRTKDEIAAAVTKLTTKGGS